MILKSKIPFFILTLLIAINCGQARDLKKSNPSKAGFDSDRLNRIDKMIQECVDREEVPGAVGILIKDGKIAVENGQIKEYIWGKTHTVTPEYDKAIEKDLSKFFDKYHTMKLDNYIISDDEMNRLVGSPVYVNDCLRKRKQ